MSIKRLVISGLAFFNLCEGVIHLVVSGISFWGIYDTNTWDWRVCAAPATDVFMGGISLITALVLGKWGHHH